MHKTHLKKLAASFKTVKFCEVDVESEKDLVDRYRVHSVLMIIIFDGQDEKIRCSGDNIMAVKRKLYLLVSEDEERIDSQQVDLVVKMLDDKNCFCLNDNDDHPFINSLKTNSSVLRSDMGQKLIISLAFR